MGVTIGLSSSIYIETCVYIICLKYGTAGVTDSRDENNLNVQVWSDPLSRGKLQGLGKGYHQRICTSELPLNTAPG